MEVWALEAYAASNILQEMITIKSDDVAGRTQVYEAIVKNMPIKKPNIPESFNVLVKELNKRGEKVKILVRKTSNLEPLKGCNCEYIYGDILDPQSIESQLKDVDTIFHLAAHIKDCRN